MNRATLRLVLLVSCAHAMIHVFELSLPSVEQLIADEFQVDKSVTGMLGMSWRLPWGLGALLAGWLVDRYGSQPLLAVCLLGCAAMCLLAGVSVELPALFVVMFLMGSLASIYHPAGLALISHETDLASRPRALGIHGVFGSAGIGAAPFLAGFCLSLGMGWRDYYWALSLPAIVLGLTFLIRATSRRLPPADSPPQHLSRSRDATVRDTSAPIEGANWASFFTLTTLAMFMGFSYSAVLNFLPRYLGDAFPNRASGAAHFGFDSYLAGGVLLMGCLGQYAAGRWADHRRLERQLRMVLFATVPCLLWMSVAQQWHRLAAAATFACIHFMHQPLYNSLIAKYTPRQRRSLCYGFSFAMGLGIGGTGAAFAGFSRSETATYATLAGLTAIAGLLATVLCRRHPVSGN